MDSSATTGALAAIAACTSSAMMIPGFPVLNGLYLIRIGHDLLKIKDVRFRYIVLLST